MSRKTLRRINSEALAGPFRPTNWRHREAVSLISERRTPSPRLHDDITSRLAFAYQRLRNGRTLLDQLRIRKIDRDAYGAIGLRFDGSHRMRCLVEAMILADEEEEKIASRVGVASEVVHFYGEAYYDIRSRLGSRDFVLHAAICLDEARGDSEKLIDVAVRLFGYLGGTPAIDVLTASLGPSTENQTVSDTLSLLAKRARILLQLKILSTELGADPRLAKSVMEVVDSIENSSLVYGDEAAPRNKKDVIEAELFALVRGEPGRWKEV